MFVDYDSLEEAFRQIRSEASRLPYASTVMVFVALDCDSLCAASILTSLLRAESLLYTLIPVAGWESLSEHKETIQNRLELRSVVLINCGGVVDLMSHFEPPETVCFYVLDSHRPFNLQNVYETKQVVLFDDGNAREALPELYESESSDEDDDDEEDEDTELEDEEEDSPSSGKRKRAGQESAMEYAERRDRRRRRAAEKEEYYRQSYYGASAAQLAYTLASQMSMESNEHLWLAIVGLTDMFVHDKIDSEEYRDTIAVMGQEVQSKNIETRGERLLEDGLVVPAADKDCIRFHEEFRLMLYRHWSLFDSLQHSNYVATRLGVWREAGEEKLNRLIATMGLPIREMREKYSVLNQTFKDRFDEMLRKHSTDFDLGDITFDSFVKYHEYNTPIAAADVVHSVSALLEFANRANDEDDRPWQANFHEAYDALSNPKKLSEGITRAISLQRSLVAVGTQIIIKKMISRTEHFDHVTLEYTPDHEIFTQPLALSKLALFLRQALAEGQKSKRHARRAKSLVVAMNVEARGTYLVVGVTGTEQKNVFGTAFRDAATRTSARYKHDSFETSVMEVQREDLVRFMKCLYTTSVLMMS